MGKPRAVIWFVLQPAVVCFDIVSDADWAGCRTARKSTGGGVVMMGRCCVKSWRKTQGTIVQRSAESELIATVRGATEGLGLIPLSQDMAGVQSPAPR